MKKLLFLAATCLLLAQCGLQSDDGTSCVPNVIDNLQLQVTAISPTVYSFQVCSAPSGGLVFSVYGGAAASDVSGGFNVNAAVREGHVVSSATPFQVTFQSSDNYFSIYQDQYSGGSYVLDNSSTPLVQARLLPGH